MKLTSLLFSLFAMSVLSVYCYGCSSDETDNKKMTQKPKEEIAIANPYNLNEEELDIQDLLNEALIRLRYGDKTGLYNLEFEYFLDEYSFDDYLKRGEIQYAVMDSINHVEVKGCKFYPESVIVSIDWVFDSPTGKNSYHADKLKLFKQGDVWKKPTSSSYPHQLEYERIIREADSAAAADEG